MKRLILYFILYLLVIETLFTSLVLYNKVSQKVTINSKLILGRNFYVKIEYGFDTHAKSEIEVILKGKPYEVKFEKNAMNVDEYGCVGKLYRYKNYWVGKISSGEGDSCRTSYFSQNYSLLADTNLGDYELRTNISKIQDKYSGYFIINENIEKTGLSEKELLEYLKIEKIKELKFKNGEYYIEKYGNEIIMSPYYDSKNVWVKSKDQIIEEFEKERKSNIVTCIYIIIMGIIGIIGIVGVIYFKKRDKKLSLR